MNLQGPDWGHMNFGSRCQDSKKWDLIHQHHLHPLGKFRIHISFQWLYSLNFSAMRYQEDSKAEDLERLYL